MAVTIQQIAEAVGVSRGTVDRALNNRGRINPEVAKRVQRAAEEMGYIPRNRRTKKGRRLRIGVVTQLAKSSFMLEVNRGIRDAAMQLEDRGAELVLKECLSVDENEQLTAIEALEAEGIDGLALMPVDCEGIRIKMNRMIDRKNIPVITFNSDIVGTYEGGNVNLMMANKNGDHVEEAKDFINFMSEPDNYNEAFDGISTAAVFKGQTTNVNSRQYEENKESVDKLIRASSAQPKIVGYNQGEGGKALLQLMSGDISVEECIKLIDDDRIATLKSFEQE